MYHNMYTLRTYINISKEKAVVYEDELGMVCNNNNNNFWCIKTGMDVAYFFPSINIEIIMFYVLFIEQNKRESIKIVWHYKYAISHVMAVSTTRICYLQTVKHITIINNIKKNKNKIRNCSNVYKTEWLWVYTRTVYRQNWRKIRNSKF